MRISKEWTKDVEAEASLVALGNSCQNQKGTSSQVPLKYQAKHKVGLTFLYPFLFVIYVRRARLFPEQTIPILRIVCCISTTGNEYFLALELACTFFSQPGSLTGQGSRQRRDLRAQICAEPIGWLIL